MFNQELLGSTIDDRYKITAFLGQGGMGAVYKAREVGLERELALKLMHACHLTDPESLSRFEREGKVLSSLQHPNIITIYRFGLWNDQIPYLAMEYLPGKTLKEILDTQTRLSPERTLRIAIHLCDALAYAHNHGIVHRDIKPSNIIISSKPEADSVKIVDFGLIKLLPESWQLSQKLTQTGLLIGTAQYLSPELCLGKKVDKRSDIYSLAAMIYECIAGQPPLDAENPIGLIHKHAHEMPVALSEIFSGKYLPEGLDFVLMKALQKDPDLRYQTVEDLREALVLAEKGEAVFEPGNSTLRPWSGATPKQKIPRDVFAALIGTTVLLGIIFGLQFFNSQKAVSETRISTVSAKQHITRRLKEAEELSLAAEQHRKQPTNCAAYSARALAMLSHIPTNKNPAVENTAHELKILAGIHSLLTDESILSHLPELNDKLNSLSLRYKYERNLKADILVTHIQSLIADRAGDLQKQLLTHGFLAQLYLETGNHEACRQEIKKKEDLLKEHHIELTRENVSILQTKAEYLWQTDKEKSSEIRQCLHEAYRILRRLNNEAPETIFLRTSDIGFRSVDTGDYSFGKKVLLEGRELILHGAANNAQLVNIDRALTEVEMKLGHYDKAKKYCLEEIEVRSSQPNSERDPLLLTAEETLKNIERLHSAHSKR